MTTIEELNAELLRAFPLADALPDGQPWLALEVTDLLLETHTPARIVERLMHDLRRLPLVPSLVVFNGRAMREHSNGRRDCIFVLPKLEE